jgi:hypothetical protein
VVLDYVPGCRQPPLCEPLEPLEGVVDEDPVLVGLRLAVWLHRRSSCKQIIILNKKKKDENSIKLIKEKSVSEKLVGNS